jgi:hypothetical protein
MIANKNPTVTVPWIVGRRRAIARAMAIYSAATAGRLWSNIPQTIRDQLVQNADETIGQWAESGLLATFNYEYLEADQPSFTDIPPAD